MEAILETFKDIPGYKGLYQVSDCGCVRSLKYGKVKYLKPAKCRGYERIDLCRDGEKKMFSIHRLVYEAFNGPIQDGYEIDHVNTVRDDNRLSNLRVVTSKENHANPITAERKRETNQRLSKEQKWIEANREAGKRRSQDPKWREAQRERTRKSHNKPILQIEKTTGEVIREWECARDAERELVIDHRNIAACCLGKRKSAGGYRWRFA